MGMSKNTVWKTRMFEIADEKGLSLGEITKLGGYHYSKGYLSRIKNGLRGVPDSLDFQNWVAQILKMPREYIFFVEVLPTDNKSDVTRQQG
jgi:transcriptional regulator with XRE-family HTH domain